jgi:hypothetical protein
LNRRIAVCVMADEENEGGVPSTPWLHLLEPHWREWRRSQHLKGRNPDPYIEQQLRDAGAWPPKPTKQE